MGEASLMAVTSGKVQWAATQATSSTCGTSNVLIGGGLPARSGSGGSNIYNEVKYSLTNSDTCSDPLEHGTNGYSQTDMRTDRSTLTSTRAALCTTTSSGLRSIMMRQHQTTFFTRVNCGS